MITQTFNLDIVNLILSHPDIWPEIAPVGVRPFEVGYVPGVMYFLVNDSDGIIALHPFRDSIKIHPNFPKKNRGKVAYKAVDEVCRLMLTVYHCVYAEIDPKLRHVTRFAKHLGFNLLESGDRDIFIRRKLDS